MGLETFIAAIFEFIIAKISESGTPIKSVILAFGIISLTITAKVLFDYVCKNFNDIVRRLQGKHRIDSLKEEAQQIRQKIIKARQSLKSYNSSFGLEVDQATGAVKALRIVPGFKNKHERAIDKVALLKQKNQNQNLEIDGILSEMLANSNAAERWFATRQKVVAEEVRKHSPVRKQRKN